ncbi:MAG: class I SAM-dependent methyltransferase [Candidatus Latescibacterota bacterium]
MSHVITLLNRLFPRVRVSGRESRHAYSSWEHRVGQDLVQSFLEPTGDLRGKRVLDIGCGLGGKTIAYGEGGASQVFGTDLSLEFANASASYADQRDASFVWGFFAGDAASLPLADAAFDTVVANDTMEHFTDPVRAFSEMIRVTKPGGAIWIFFTPYFSPLGSHLYDYIYIPWCHLIFTRRQLLKAITEIFASGEGRAPSTNPVADAEKVMASFDRDLNRMSVRRFFKMVKDHPSLVITYRELKPPKYNFVKALNRLPLIRELFTGSLICRLEKQG